MLIHHQRCSPDYRFWKRTSPPPETTISTLSARPVASTPPAPLTSTLNASPSIPRAVKSPTPLTVTVLSAGVRMSTVIPAFGSDVLVL
jgi:hypothetical protein